MIHTGIGETLIKNYMPYTTYVILERALPEIDGFKPSQRRILYTMFKMGLLGGDDEDRKKSQGVVGQTMFLHPHGDASIYETMVRMTTDAESFLTPYINSKGNFGKQYSRDMSYASARYTEVKMAAIAEELFRDINNHAVEMVDNYDGTLKEPRLLPVSFPSILTNVQSGTAVGMGSNIASFNLAEVIDATVAYIKNPKLDITDYIQAPDFPSGATILYDKAKFDEILQTGRGSFDIRATHRFEDNSIYFEEIPYTTTVEAIMDKISNLVKEGKLKEVVNIHNNYGLTTTGVEVVFKNGTDKEKLVQKLFRLTPLQSSFGCNFNMVVNDRPRVLGVKEIIHEWVQFRVASIRKSTAHRLNKSKERMHNLKALEKVILDVEKTIAIVRGTRINSEVIANLMEALAIDEVQAEFVADIKLKHLNVEYLQDRIKEIQTLQVEIDRLDKLLNDRKTLALFIIKQLEEVKAKYGQERKTKIVELGEIPVETSEAEPVDNYNLRLFVTKEGYLKKIPLTSLRGSFTIKVKDGDQIERMIESSNDSDILVYTSKRNVYKLKTHELEDHKPSVLGEYLPALLKLKDEEILYITATSDYSGHLLIGYEDGKMAKIDMKAYETKQNRSMLKNGYADKQALYFHHATEEVDVLAISSIDKALVFNTSMINSKTSKTTIGVQAMKEKKDSKVVAYHTLAVPHEKSAYYRTSSAGVGKYLRKGDFSELLGGQATLNLD